MFLVMTETLDCEYNIENFEGDHTH